MAMLNSHTSNVLLCLRNMSKVKRKCYFPDDISSSVASYIFQVCRRMTKFGFFNTGAISLIICLSECCQYCHILEAVNFTVLTKVLK